MQIIRSESTVFVDIDDTLVTAYKSDSRNKAVKIEDPLNPGIYLKMSVHEPMVRLVKEESHRGSFIVIWSRGGHEWATSVIKALDLQNYVNIVMSKPMVYFDDTPIEKWLTYRVYLEPEMRYKR